MQLLGGLSPEQFLQEYWQRQPLLIRQAIPDYQCPVDPNDLAGLALEESVESRIIRNQSETGTPWPLSKGPFTEDDFQALPANDWTLLIQQLDALVPEINALKELFNFIPNWRIDDIMASFAPSGGSVGPHFDQYDVFLLQAEGERRWKVGQWCDASTELVEGTPLSILSEFETQEEWVLSPGDMLYLPPKLAHWGVAEKDCITLSVGFRAPSDQDLLGKFADFVMSSDCTPIRFQDAAPSLQTSSAALSKDSQTAFKNMLIQQLESPGVFAKAMLETLTEPKNPDLIQALPEEEMFSSSELREELEQGAELQQNEGSRFVFVEEEMHVFWGVDGAVYTLPLSDLELVKQLSETLSPQTLESGCSAKAIEVLLELINGGSFVLV